jgi:cobalt-zinc-cadmium efflux system outer membrane protein
LQAEQDLFRVQQDVELAEERLRNLLGLSACRIPLVLRRSECPAVQSWDVEPLTVEAIRGRPDAQAADEAIAASAERVRLAKLVWVRLIGIGDATSGRGTGHELSPALRLTVPIFNWNQGNIARAEGELERAVKQRQTVTNQIILDVHQAHTRVTQTRGELDWLQSKVRPEVEAAIRRAERAYQGGDTTYIVVLETTRQLLDSRFREAQLRADFQRAWADLERSVGRRLADANSLQPPSAPPMPAAGDGPARPPAREPNQP